MPRHAMPHHTRAMPSMIYIQTTLVFAATGASNLSTPGSADPSHQPVEQPREQRVADPPSAGVSRARRMRAAWESGSGGSRRAAPPAAAPLLQQVGAKGRGGRGCGGRGRGRRGRASTRGGVAGRGSAGGMHAVPSFGAFGPQPVHAPLPIPVGQIPVAMAVPLPCHATPCHARAMPCHAMPCHAMPCHTHATPAASAPPSPPDSPVLSPPPSPTPPPAAVMSAMEGIRVCVPNDEHGRQWLLNTLQTLSCLLGSQVSFVSHASTVAGAIVAILPAEATPDEHGVARLQFVVEVAIFFLGADSRSVATKQLDLLTPGAQWVLMSELEENPTELHLTPILPLPDRNIPGTFLNRFRHHQVVVPLQALHLPALVRRFFEQYASEIRSLVTRNGPYAPLLQQSQLDALDVKVSRAFEAASSFSSAGAGTPHLVNEYLTLLKVLKSDAHKIFLEFSRKPIVYRTSDQMRYQLWCLLMQTETAVSGLSRAIAMVICCVDMRNAPLLPCMPAGPSAPPSPTGGMHPDAPTANEPAPLQARVSCTSRLVDFVSQYTPSIALLQSIPLRVANILPPASTAGRPHYITEAVVALPPSEAPRSREPGRPLSQWDLALQMPVESGQWDEVDVHPDDQSHPGAMGPVTDEED